MAKMLELIDYLELLYSLDCGVCGESESIDLISSLNANLASDFVCKYDIPRFDNSAMDGYAVRLNESGEYKILDDCIFAGEDKNLHLKVGEAVKTMTGGAIAYGANAVIPKENVRVEGENLTALQNPQLGANIKVQGEEFKAGAKLLGVGEKINLNHLTLLASQGADKIKVFRKPKIMIFSSGNEIVKLGQNLGRTQIYDINSVLLRATLELYGYSIDCGEILSDDEDEIFNALNAAIERYDIIITSGGASVGDKDYIKSVLHRLESKILVDCVNIKPGKPVILSQVSGKILLSLPGNPIASLINCLLSVPILCEKISGGRKFFIKPINAINASDFSIKRGVSNIMLGKFDNGIFHAFRDGKYQASQISPLCEANAMAIFGESNAQDSTQNSPQNMSDKNAKNAPKSGKITIKKDSIIKIIPFKYDFLDTMRSVINEMA